MNANKTLQIILALFFSCNAFAIEDISEEEVRKSLPGDVTCDAYRDFQLSHKEFGKVSIKVTTGDVIVVDAISTNEERLNFKIGGPNYPRKPLSVFADKWKCQYFFGNADGKYGFVYACSEMEEPQPFQKAPTVQFWYSKQYGDGNICNGSPTTHTNCWALRNCK